MIESHSLHPLGLGLALEYVTRCLSITHSRPEQEHLAPVVVDVVPPVALVVAVCAHDGSSFLPLPSILT